jgi:hypothetical protein
MNIMSLMGGNIGRKDVGEIVKIIIMGVIQVV